MTNPDNNLEYIAQIQNELLRQKEEIAQLKKQQLQSDRIVAAILESTFFLLGAVAVVEENVFAKSASKHMENLLDMSSEFIDTIDAGLRDRLIQQLDQNMSLIKQDNSFNPLG